MLEKTLEVVKKNATDLEIGTRSVLHHLEYKAVQKVAEGVGDEIQGQQIAAYCAEANLTINTSTSLLA